MDSVGMALSSRPLWPRTHRASSRFTWEDMSCAGTRGSVPGERGPYFLEFFFSLLVTRVFCGQNHGCQPSRGQHKHLGSLLEICGTLRSRKFQEQRSENIQEKGIRKRIWWLMAAIPSVKRLRQENHHELEDSLSYIVSSNPGWAQSKTISQKTRLGQHQQKVWGATDRHWRWWALPYNCRG